MSQLQMSLQMIFPSEESARSRPTGKVVRIWTSSNMTKDATASLMDIIHMSSQMSFGAECSGTIWALLWPRMVSHMSATSMLARCQGELF